MQWRDEGRILAVIPYGERDAILDVLTPTQGRVRGFVIAGASRRYSQVLQPGNVVDLRWRARLADQLGRFQVELIRSPLGAVLAEPTRLEALSAALAVVSASLPEQEAAPALYQSLAVVIDLISEEAMNEIAFAAALVRMELGLLSSLGFGLDLEKCAATGERGGLVYVSPKTGRAVSEAPGQPYRSRLMPLPAFLAGGKALGLTAAEVLDGLRLTSYFLSRHVWSVKRGGAPAARARLQDRMSTIAAASEG